MAGAERSASEYRQYTIRRLLKLPLVLLLVSIVVFVISRLGGSPAGIYISHNMTPEQIAQVYERYHLNDPVWEQYFIWLWSVVRGDLGWSGVAAAPVSEVLFKKAAVTFELGVGAGLVSLVFGVALGTYGGSRRDRAGDHVTRVVSSMGASLPEFWFALIALYVGFLILGIAPVGRSDPNIFASIAHPTGLYSVDAILNGSWRAFVDAVYHLWLPVLVLGFVGTAEIARFMRASLIEQLGADYVDSARARGLSEKLIAKRHARRNALIPTITMAGIAFGGILQGAVVVEQIFRLPGMGAWITDAMLRGDQATVLAFVLVTALGYSLVNLAVDLAYAHFDPRITLST